MPGRWVGGIAGLELSAGLSEEGQGSGCRPGPTLAGRGGPRAASPEGSLVALGIGAGVGALGRDQNRKGTVKGLLGAGVWSWPEKGGN